MSLAIGQPSRDPGRPQPRFYLMGRCPHLLVEHFLHGKDVFCRDSQSELGCRCGLRAVAVVAIHEQTTLSPTARRTALTTAMSRSRAASNESIHLARPTLILKMRMSPDRLSSQDALRATISAGS